MNTSNTRLPVSIMASRFRGTPNSYSTYFMILEYWSLVFKQALNTTNTRLPVSIMASLFPWTSNSYSMCPLFLEHCLLVFKQALNTINTWNTRLPVLIIVPLFSSNRTPNSYGRCLLLLEHCCWCSSKIWTPRTPQTQGYIFQLWPLFFPQTSNS